MSRSTATPVGLVTLTVDQPTWCKTTHCSSETTFAV